jgi:hypothetical protein
MKQFQFQVPIYNVWIAVLVEPTQLDLDKFNKKFFRSNPLPMTKSSATTFVDGSRNIALIFNDIRQDIIVHESFHVCQGVLEAIGIKSISMVESEECFAYLLQFVFNKIKQGIDNAKK